MFAKIIASTFIALFILYIIAFIFYPSFIAYKRKHKNLIPIIIVNFLTGLTGLGYLISLAWSFSSNAEITHKDKKLLLFYLTYVCLPIAIILIVLIFLYNK